MDWHLSLLCYFFLALFLFSFGFSESFFDSLIKEDLGFYIIAEVCLFDMPYRKNFQIAVVRTHSLRQLPLATSTARCSCSYRGTHTHYTHTNTLTLSDNSHSRIPRSQCSCSYRGTHIGTNTHTHSHTLTNSTAPSSVHILGSFTLQWSGTRSGSGLG